MRHNTEVPFLSPFCPFYGFIFDLFSAILAISPRSELLRAGSGSAHLRGPWGNCCVTHVALPPRMQKLDEQTLLQDALQFVCNYFYSQALMNSCIAYLTVKRGGMPYISPVKVIKKWHGTDLSLNLFSLIPTVTKTGKNITSLHSCSVFSS